MFSAFSFSWYPTPKLSARNADLRVQYHPDECMHNALNWLIFTNICFVSKPVFSAQFILIFQLDFHLSPSGFFEPLTFILSCGAVRMTEVMLLACSLESWWWQWQLLLQAHRSLQVCNWYSHIILTFSHSQNEKSVKQKPVGHGNASFMYILYIYSAREHTG